MNKITQGIGILATVLISGVIGYVVGTYVLNSPSTGEEVTVVAGCSTDDQKRYVNAMTGASGLGLTSQQRAERLDQLAASVKKSTNYANNPNCAVIVFDDMLQKKDYASARQLLEKTQKQTKANYSLIANSTLVQSMEARLEAATADPAVNGDAG